MKATKVAVGQQVFRSICKTRVFRMQVANRYNLDQRVMACPDKKRKMAGQSLMAEVKTFDEYPPI